MIARQNVVVGITVLQMPHPEGDQTAVSGGGGA